MSIKFFVQSVLPPVVYSLGVTLLHRLRGTENKDWHTIRKNVLKEIIPAGGVGAEIGVYKGHFTPVLIEALKPTKLHLFDPWYLMGAEWTWGPQSRSTVDGLIQVINQNRKYLVDRTVDLHIGFDLETLALISDHYFDWVYLDTSHTYDQTKRELAILKDKVKPNGIISGDDWQVFEDKNPTNGVPQAVNEFIASNPYEFIYVGEEDQQWAIRRKEIM